MLSSPASPPWRPSPWPDAAASTAADPAGSGGKLDVVASFYPLEFIARTVGGDAVNVTTLTAPGVEPHDLELTPKQVGQIARREAGRLREGACSPPSTRRRRRTPRTPASTSPRPPRWRPPAPTSRSTEDGAGTAAKPAAYTEDALDPHFWLDPVRYADVVKAVTDKLVATDSANADGYQAARRDAARRGRQARHRLQDRSGELQTQDVRDEPPGLRVPREAVRSADGRHRRVHPGRRADPGRGSRRSRTSCETQQVTTIFYEELVSPKVAETIARDVGVKTAVLSPIEGLSDANSQETYLTLMRENLQELRKANSCA